MKNFDYCIGVVTYHARFDSYFKPLIQQLSKVFPDKEIICIINGHPDRTLQINYLKKVTSFLKAFPNVRYLTYDTNQSLSKCWNQLIILANTPQILILNDDTSVSELFRNELETDTNNYDTYTINNSWSHFVISKETVKTIGWFDERFLGVGHEDGDYAYRMAMQKVKVGNIECSGLRNFVGDQSNPGWTKISTTTGGLRYADINKDFFNKKWQTSLNSPETTDFLHVCYFNNTPFPFNLNPGMETPVFYDFTVLDQNTENVTGVVFSVSSLKLSLQKIYFTVGRFVARLLRKLSW